MNYKLCKIESRLIRYILYVAMFLLFCITLFMLNGVIEMKPVDLIISSFKERGEYLHSTYINGQKVDMYIVKSYYDYEKNDARTTFRKNEEGVYHIGSNLDIILTNRNPLRAEPMAIVQDFGNFFAKNFFIGHASINVNEDGSEMIDAVGNSPEDNGVKIKLNDWISTEISRSNDAQMIIGLRIKNLNNEKIEKVNSNLLECEGLKYNYNLLISKKNSYYCTDLITRNLRKENIEIDYDGLYPTGNDFIISNNTFIIFICERIEDKFNIYYMSEE